MKKYLFIILALLLTVGVANATNIPQISDPKNYPIVWTEVVYNGSGSTITSGYVVQWDFDTSDSDAGTEFDDVCPWVKLADAASDIWTAGVVPLGQNILNTDVGRIVIKGPTAVYRGVNGTALTVDTVCETSATGLVQDETITGGDKTFLGIVIKASAAANDISGDATSDFSIIYVDPTTAAN